MKRINGNIITKKNNKSILISILEESGPFSQKAKKTIQNIRDMSGIRVCIDTNVFLNVLNRERKFYSNCKRVLNAVDQGKLIAVIPTLVISEILTGFYTDSKDDKADQFLFTIIANKNIEVVQLSIEIGALAAVIRSRTGLRLPVAWYWPLQYMKKQIT